MHALGWIIFGVIVVFMLGLDLGVFHRQARAVSLREAWTWMIVWVAIGLGFALGVWAYLGKQRALEYVTAYLIEESLSVDNIFVFIVLFRFFAVPDELEHRVLFWGIIGAIVMRGVLIVAGTTLIKQFHWMTYIFGAILVFTGLKMLFSGGEQVHPERNPLLRAVRRLLPVTSNYEGQHFLVRRPSPTPSSDQSARGKLWATPLLMVLLVVESSDLLFALDSVPAVIGVNPHDPSTFIIVTSNIFAILGLRSLYFVVAGVLDKFRYLKVGLSFVLMFVGTKMIVTYWELDVPILWSLGVVGGLILVSVLASMMIPPKNRV
ncbi:MAG TPA: TerC family protein [Phycisphaerae bacterium]